MGDPRGFQKYKRETAKYRPVEKRLKDYKDVVAPLSHEQSQKQACRCMDCGTPFCHWGCPLGNYIPEWNDLAYSRQWKKAYQLLEATNNMPEITARLCPAPCEYACVLGINDDPITIRENEFAVIEYAFKHNLIKAHPPKVHTGKRVAVVGSGPAGLAAAAQLNKAGHKVVIFERNKKIGGLLRYGIPDFKLEKEIIDRRLKIWEEEGIEFKTSVNVGVDITIDELLKDFDAICLACGSSVPRDLPIEGRELQGIHFAMEYLAQSNRIVSGEGVATDSLISAKDKNVIVIGGGDTGSDCVGTAHRQGAKSVVQLELFPQPAESRTDDSPWPVYPRLLKTTSSHQEGGERLWSVMTKKFTGQAGKVSKLSCIKVDSVLKEIAGTAFELDADLVILAMGFVHPEHKGIVEKLGLELDKRGNIKTDQSYLTSKDKVFAAGDMHRGQSLICWAIAEGREAAGGIDRYLRDQS